MAPSAQYSSAAMTEGYRQVDHTADLALELWASTEEALLQIGARAIVDVLTEEANVTGDSEVCVELDAVDAEDRLVQWLNEIIVAAVVDGFLTTSADIALREGGLTATLRGRRDSADMVATELKSATYHDLRLEQRDGAWHAHVVIDV